MKPFLAALTFLLASYLPSWGDEPIVDVALVLAVDVSGSIDAEEYKLQTEGIAEAISSPRVLDAIANGDRQAIAITYVQWSAAQRVMAPWTIIHNANDAHGFAALVRSAPRAFAGWTALGEAIAFSSSLFSVAPCAQRMVIDVSGDGISNNGRRVSNARDEAVTKGIVINGLAITNEEPGLKAYYEENVVGGAGSFAIPALDFADFSNAMLAKLEREIAGVAPAKKYASR